MTVSGAETVQERPLLSRKSKAKEFSSNSVPDPKLPLPVAKINTK